MDDMPKPCPLALINFLGYDPWHSSDVDGCHSWWVSQLSLVLRSHGENVYRRPRNPRIIITAGTWMRVLDDRWVYKGDAHIHTLMSSKCIFAKDRNVFKNYTCDMAKKSLSQKDPASGTMGSMATCRICSRWFWNKSGRKFCGAMSLVISEKACSFNKNLPQVCHVNFHVRCSGVEFNQQMSIRSLGAASAWCQRFSWYLFGSHRVITTL